MVPQSSYTKNESILVWRHVATNGLCSEPKCILRYPVVFLAAQTLQSVGRSKVSDDRWYFLPRPALVPQQQRRVNQPLLFAVAIGPLNYWLLKRKNKLPMLLATVPIAAAVTTLLLFIYGIFADGFTVRICHR